MNEILFFIEIIITFSAILVFQKVFNKNGLYIWIAIASIIANIQVIKNINLLGMDATLGNVMFASIFLATDILSENYGKKEAQKGVYVGIFSIVVYIISMQLSLSFIPSEIDNSHNSMKLIFGLMPRVCLSSIIMYITANLADVYIFDKLKKQKLWIRNNISTILCNCLENFGFVFLAFLGVYHIYDVLKIALSTSMIEIIIAICDTPFLYMAKRK